MRRRLATFFDKSKKQTTLKTHVKLASSENDYQEASPPSQTKKPTITQLDLKSPLNPQQQKLLSKATKLINKEHRCMNKPITVGKHPINTTQQIVSAPTSPSEKEHYYILGRQKAGHGSHGDVYDIEGDLIRPKQSPLSPKKSPLIFTKTDSDHVLKIIPYKKETNQEEIKREARNITVSNSPLKAFNTFFDKDNGYIEMNKIKGISLRHLTIELNKKKISLQCEELLLATLNIMKAVADLHKEGLLHRDIKPENIIIDPENNFSAVLVDRALCCSFDNPGDEVVGTPMFIAPESYAKAEYSVKSDYFSLGCTLQYLWGDNSLYKHKMTNNEQKKDCLEFFYNLHRKRKVEGLYKNREIAQEFHDKLENTLRGLSRFNKNKRIPLSRAIKYTAELLAAAKIERFLKEMESSQIDITCNTKQSADDEKADYCSSAVTSAEEDSEEDSELEWENATPRPY